MHSFWAIAEKHQECPEPHEDKFLLMITVAAAVLFCILAGFILWLILKVTACLSVWLIEFIFV